MGLNSTDLALVVLVLAAGCAEPSPPVASPAPEGAAEDAAASPADAAAFVDGTRLYGLDHVHRGGASGEFYPPEIMGAGAALFDADRDGDLDAFLVHGHVAGTDQDGGAGTDALFRNDPGDGTGKAPRRFVDVTRASGLRTSARPAGGYGMGVAAGDFDADGWVDLYVTSFGPNRMLHNQGAGDDGVVRFADVSAATGTADERWSVPAVFFDYDRDGWLDLYVGNYLAMKLEHNLVCRSVTGARDYCAPDAYPGAADRLYRNLADGTFADVTAQAGLGGEPRATLGAVAADFDGDGWLDLYVANDRQPNRLWINQGRGGDGRVSFRDEAPLAGCAVNHQGVSEAGMGVAAADFDGDGDLDIFVTHLTGETHTLYVNDGHGLFDDRTVGSGLGPASRTMTGFGTAALDFDNDGRLDLLAVDGAVRILEELSRERDPFPFHQPNQLFRNVSGGSPGDLPRFEEVTGPDGGALSLSETSRGAAFGDVDDDGDVDVLVVNNHGPARLLINRTGQARHWLGLRLVSERPGDAVGARVALERRHAPTMWRRSHSDGSYASASDPRVLFGLGEGAQLSAVTVYWSGGDVERWTDLEIDTYATLRKGSGTSL